ncbi:MULTISPECIES: GNAT family N-acetyltransferase [Streptomyces]|jgi:GNAT superfamily N-acetyltransferase|uniref:Ribosomal protein S18 acetylase RimI n=1 Tax=Streptomyces radiopugnans TaxID=403935 RepID=A0A1H9GJN2_9ACTN|nr:GNAT family N-acetyltransferase [Streptomyces radiopugnans]URN12880.1 GNAT family N-acetyltransferase [Streptomyces radiopugnans]SEQ50253.1 Ribosomal protein S18 acetylase RimI [Streptomyces radiopugnans]
MTLRYVLDPPVDRRLTDGICALWAQVTNAGGAVGFVPPVTDADVRPELTRHLTAMAEGRARLLAAYDEEERVAGTAFLMPNTHRLMRHWVWLYTVMLRPDRQGRGEGRALMAAVEEAARGMDGVRGIRLTCRGGLGLEHFYGSCGYKEVGRVPDAIRVADDDLRDDITMWLRLS